MNPEQLNQQVLQQIKQQGETLQRSGLAQKGPTQTSTPNLKPQPQATPTKGRHL